MVFKDHTFFSYVFLATVVILFTGHAHGAGLCDNSPNKQVCYSIVYNRNDPRDASVAACHKLIYETNVANKVARRLARSIEIDSCISQFNLAVAAAKQALDVFKTGNYKVMRASINSTQVCYQDCDNAYENYGKTNPLAKSTKHLKDLASVGAYLVSLIKN